MSTATRDQSTRSDLAHLIGRDPADRWEAAVLLESRFGCSSSEALELGERIAELCDPRHGGPRPQVALITEGTYPFSYGGVSTWCDHLVRGMPVHRFTLHAVTARRGRDCLWDLPPNVEELVERPCWEDAAPGERSRLVRTLTPSRPAPHAVDAVNALIELLTDPSAGPASRTDAVIDDLIRHAGAGELSPALRSADAFATLCAAWAASGTDASVSDVGTALDLLEHLWRPVSGELPRADLYHPVSNGLAGLVAIAAASEHPGPIVVSEHGVYLRERYLEHADSSVSPQVRDLLLGFHRLIATAVYRRADRVVPVSRYNRRWALHNGVEPARVRVVRNGVDHRRIPAGPARRVRSEPDRAPTIGFVSRIDRIKDPLTLIEAAALLASDERPPRVRLWGEVAAGGEEYAEACRESVDRLGLTEHVTFEGRTSDPVGAYRTSDVVVSCSISEGMPYGVIEAMMSGAAIVATTVGGVPEMLGDTGRLVAPGEPALLAAACRELLAAPELRAELGAAARRRALALFDQDEMIAAYRSIYDGLVPTIDLRRPEPRGVHP